LFLILQIVDMATEEEYARGVVATGKEAPFHLMKKNQVLGLSVQIQGWRILLLELC
jgi:hypothetical protein